jgi:hypothetical protein
LLRDIDQLETQEVANLLGVTPNAAKVRLHRGRQALRTLIERERQRADAVPVGASGAYAAATVTRPPSPSEECHAQPPQEPLRRCGSREDGRDGCKLSHRAPSRGAQRSDAPGPGRFRSLVDTCTKKEHPPAV